MRLLVLIAFASLAVMSTGCAKSYKKFYETERIFQLLVASRGDDAYLSAEMEDLIFDFKAVPKEAREYPRARALLDQIDRERIRIGAERAAAEPPRPEPEPDFFPPSGPSGPSPSVADAEPGQPAAPAAEGPPSPGMTEEAFRRQYGSCISGPETLDVGGVKRPAYQASEADTCKRKLGITEPTRFFFVDGRLGGTATVTINREATAAAEKVRQDFEAARAAAEKGQQVLLVPGAPLPQGFNNAPPANPGNVPATATGTGMPTSNLGTSSLQPSTP